MRPLMVLGCTSDAGKSLLVTALCAWFRRAGVSVAPFKAQNMSNNARVVATEHGAGEIGVAQWLQARAAGIEPDVRINPVLLKPEADTQSQVVVRGQVDWNLTATPWSDRHDALWTPMAEAFDDLRAEFDLVVLEGAGSPAEINLVDQVNNRMIEYADAAALLVSDIDRGGSFAHIYGTWALVPEATRQRLSGFVLNRFRGDPTLLAPGPERLTAMTGMADVGTIPMLPHHLPREEGAPEPAGWSAAQPPGAPTVVLPRLPFGSNLDEFHPLSHAAVVRWATDARLFDEADVIVLPGSKHIAADVAWMRERGIDIAVRRAVERGVSVIGVCGGAMMLGRALEDPYGVEGGRTTPMLDVLPLMTTMATQKRTAHVAVDFEHRTGVRLRHDGYEIRHGEIRPFTSEGIDDLVVGRSEYGPVAWRSNNVLATTVHGLFEDPAFVREVVGVEVRDVLEETFALLADAVEEHLDTALLREITRPRDEVEDARSCPRCGSQRHMGRSVGPVVISQRETDDGCDRTMKSGAEDVTTSAVEVVDSILATGQARMTLDVDDATLLAAVVAGASEFFARPADAKRLHSGTDANFGYRPMGIEYSVTPDRPDVNESFTVWSDRTDLIKNHQHVGALLVQTVAWQKRLAEIVAGILDRFVEVLGGQSSESIRFTRASHVQINSSLGAPPERELLQDCHEDGHLVTVLHANDIGLEAGSERQLAPVSLRPNEILVMPGSMLTLVSNGRVEPLFHQVRNAGIIGRISVMYFVNPQLDRPVYPWAQHDAPTTDLRPTIREKPTGFGLPTVPDV